MALKFYYLDLYRRSVDSHYRTLLLKVQCIDHEQEMSSGCSLRRQKLSLPPRHAVSNLHFSKIAKGLHAHLIIRSIIILVLFGLNGYRRENLETRTLGGLTLGDRRERNRIHRHIENVCHLGVHRQAHILTLGL